MNPLLNKEPVKRAEKAIKAFNSNLEIICLEKTARTAQDAAALKSLVDSCSALHSVVVIDDCSPHALPDLGAARVIRLETNSGPAAARNAGIATVDTEFIACIDVDVSITDRTISQLLPYFADATVALVAPRVKSHASTNFLGEYEVAASVLDMGESEARVCSGTRVSYVPSAMWLCRTAALRSVSGFDESLRSGEDVDMVWRLNDAGWRCRYQPQAECSHLPRTSLQKFLLQRVSYGASAAALAKRHTGKLAPAKFNVWQASTWLLVLLGMPFIALGVAIVASASTAQKLRRFPQLRDESFRIALHGTVKALNLQRAPSTACGGQLHLFLHYFHNAYECSLSLQHSGLPYTNGGQSAHILMLCVLR